MSTKTYFEATEFNNIKEILCDTVKKFPDKVVYLIKNAEEKDPEKKYKKITYKKLFSMVNSFGQFYFTIN